MPILIHEESSLFQLKEQLTGVSSKGAMSAKSNPGTLGYLSDSDGNLLEGAQGELFLYSDGPTALSIKFFKRNKTKGVAPQIDEQEIRILSALQNIQSAATQLFLCIPYTLDLDHGIQLMPRAYCDLFSYMVFISQLPSQGRNSQEQVIQQLPDLFNALITLHKNNIFHLDVKLENILIGHDGYLKLCDFGATEVLTEQSYYRKKRGTRQFWPYTYMCFLDETLQSEDDLTLEKIENQFTRNDIWGFLLTFMSVCCPDKNFSISIDLLRSFDALKLSFVSIRVEYIHLLLIVLDAINFPDPKKDENELFQAIREQVVKLLDVSIDDSPLDHVDEINEIIQEAFKSVILPYKIKSNATKKIMKNQDRIAYDVLSLLLPEIESFQRVDIPRLEGDVIKDFTEILTSMRSPEMHKIQLPIKHLEPYGLSRKEKESTTIDSSCLRSEVRDFAKRLSHCQESLSIERLPMTPKLGGFLPDIFSPQKESSSPITVTASPSL